MNPNEECRKGKKTKEFDLRQEVYTIELSQGLSEFRFKKWSVYDKLNYLPTPYVLFRVGSGEHTLLCGDSIFATPQEAAEEFYTKIKKICRELERGAYLGPDGTWDEFIV